MQKTEVVYEMKTAPKQKSSIYNMDANIVAMVLVLVSGVLSCISGLGYFVWIVPTAIYIYESQSQFVINIALQSVGLAVLIAIFQLVVYIITMVLALNGGMPAISSTITSSVIMSIFTTGIIIIYLAIIVITIIYSYKAFKYENIEIPVAGGVGFYLSSGLNKLSNKIHNIKKK